MVVPDLSVRDRKGAWVCLPGEVVHAEGGIECQPDNDYRREGFGDAIDAEWLSQEQQDQDCTSHTNDGGLGNISIDLIQALHRT